MVTLDFTSALYLGLSHPSRSLPPWSRLTTGAPAAIREPDLARRVAAGVADLLGAEDAVVAASTLHVSLDLFPMLAPRGTTIYADASLYPIARWGIERAQARGARVRTFLRHDARALRALLERDAPAPRPPLVVSDGLCPSCGRVAPLGLYAHHAREFGGRLVVDDTQAVGVLGPAGAGTLPLLGVRDPSVLTIASLAKGFGAPLAVLAGAADAIARFHDGSGTRLHCSPPAIPTLLAAERALGINASLGDRRRARLRALVARFRARLAATGLLATQWLFPVQPLRIPTHVDAADAYRALVLRGVRAVPTRDHRGTASITFVITAAHDAHAIDVAARRICEVMATAHTPESAAAHAG